MASPIPNRLARHFSTCAYNNSWANFRLLTAVGRLSDADFGATRVCFFPSLKATLNHNLTVDWYYVEALERGLAGEPVNPAGRRFFERTEPFDTCAKLHAAQRAVDRRLIELCLALTDERLDVAIFIPRSTGIKQEPAARLLPHLFQHQVHHRGQAHAMLAGTWVEPPQLDDFFCANDASIRAADFAALGYSEALVWGENG